MCTKSSLVLTTGLLGLLTLAGCESLGLGGSSSKDRDRDRVADRTSRDDDVIGRDPARTSSGRTSDPLGGRGMAGIPTAAVKVDEGTDKRMSYTPDRGGRIYVYDADDDRVVYSGRVIASDRFELDPRSRDGMMVNGRAVGTSDARLSDRHRYRLYFEPERGIRDGL